ncbi:MAG: DUF4296 domain-containing protein [Bacteroidales bacterium]|jgi:hypothetical protein|nr:DUF4296 domain-containing protein [Bacteroidales bacterium]
MRHNYTILLFLLFTTLSCSKAMVSDKDMPVIIAEIYKADRYINSNYQLILMADTTRIYETVLNHYGYSNKEFIRTIDHYLSRPAKLKSFYSQAKLIIEREQELVKEILDAQTRRDSLYAPYKRLIELSDSIVLLEPDKRAMRWILAPERYPAWNMVLSDSLKGIYETPEMAGWWITNFKPKETKLSIRIPYEKNRRAIHLPSQLIETDPYGGDYLR